MDIKERFANKDKRTIDYLCNLIDCLKEDYGKVSASWLISIDLIADQLDIYYRAMDDIDEKGLYHEDERGRTARNPQFLVMEHAAHFIVDLIKQFGATPLVKSKMRKLENKKIDPLEELLND